MVRTFRPLTLIAFASATLLIAGCGYKEKLVGKWKLVSMTPKDGEEQKLEGFGAIMEFTADGNILAGVDASSIAPEFKAMLEKSPEGAAKMNQMQEVGKYKISGSTLEFLDMKSSQESPFGKKSGGKMSFDGDTLTITADDVTVKLTRMK